MPAAYPIKNDKKLQAKKENGEETHHQEQEAFGGSRKGRGESGMLRGDTPNPCHMTGFVQVSMDPVMVCICLLKQVLSI